MARCDWQLATDKKKRAKIKHCIYILTTFTMITIEITNLDELVKEHRGPLTAMLGKIVADDEGEVEKIVIEEIRNEFERRGIRANFCSIEGIHLRRIMTS